MDLSQVIGAIAVALILAALAFGLNVKASLVRIETLLTGANGDNGIVGDVRDLKGWRRESEEQGLTRRVESLELERRHGPEDRRAAG